MYFFKKLKLNRLYKKQDKLTKKLNTCTNKAEKTVLGAKLQDVTSEINRVDADIKCHN